MKRIVVGLMILGLVIGGFLSCVLNAPESAADQTQGDSVAMTLSDDGAFGQALTRVVEDGYVADGWEYDATGALGDATIKTITFATDGTWEYKSEAYEAAEKTESDTTQAAEYEDGDATAGEAAWVTVAGARGTYSYDATTKMLTVNFNGITFVNDATPDWDVAWNATTNDIGGGEELMGSKPFVFTTFSFDDDGYSDILTEAEVGAFAIDETAICEDIGDLFTDGVDGYKYFNSDNEYVGTLKKYANADLAAPDYSIVTSTTVMTVSDTEVTYKMYNVQKNDYYSTTDDYTGLGVTAYTVYEVTMDKSYADGYQVTLDEAYQVKTYAADTFTTTTGAYTWETTWSKSATEVTNVGGYNMFQKLGTGFIAD